MNRLEIYLSCFSILQFFCYVLYGTESHQINTIDFNYSQEKSLESTPSVYPLKPKDIFKLHNFDGNQYRCIRTHKVNNFKDSRLNYVGEWRKIKTKGYSDKPPAPYSIFHFCVKPRKPSGKLSPWLITEIPGIRPSKNDNLPHYFFTPVMIKPKCFFKRRTRLDPFRKSKDMVQGHHCVPSEKPHQSKTTLNRSSFKGRIFPGIDPNAGLYSQSLQSIPTQEKKPDIRKGSLDYIINSK